MSWKDALINPFDFLNSCGGVESRHAYPFGEPSAGGTADRIAWASSPAAGVAHGPHEARFELDASAFMAALDEPAPLFLRKGRAA